MSRPRYLRLRGDWYVAVDIESGSDFTIAFSLNLRWRLASFVLGPLHVGIGRFAPIHPGRGRLRLVD